MHLLWKTNTGGGEESLTVSTKNNGSNGKEVVLWLDHLLYSFVPTRLDQVG